jgi:hypothetical protein
MIAKDMGSVSVRKHGDASPMSFATSFTTSHLAGPKFLGANTMVTAARIGYGTRRAR